MRQGEHVGVLMGTRPSALALAVALNRLGAVAVLLRPDGDIAREAELGQVERIIADPERAPLAAGSASVHTFVLGGGGGPRDLGVPLATDMEQIDPSAVTLPDLVSRRTRAARATSRSSCSPARASGTRMSRITNRRWALSAFGTASSAALSSADTVYSVTPLYHPSGLMMSIGGAVAGGARLAMATRFDPATFWDEARRYGVTVASYTWTLLHDLVEAPPQPGERHHPVRLFIGSGMPRGLWRRVQERFEPARVLEFYASTEAGAILVNLSGAKPGVDGPPAARQRGGADRRLRRRRRAGSSSTPTGSRASATSTRSGCCSRASRPDEQLSMIPLRGVFASGDAWLLTGDLFRRDADGDFWRVEQPRRDDRRAPRARCSRGRSATPSATCRRSISSSRTAFPPDDGKHELPVAAVTLRAGHELDARDIAAALSGLDRDQRPRGRPRRRPDPGHDVVPAADRLRCARPGSRSPDPASRRGTSTPAATATAR